MTVKTIIIKVICILLLICINACADKRNSLEVTASAYTSRVGETDSNPTVAAWGDELEPGMKAIAISRDLLDYGLTHRTKIEIEGLSGKYLVLDKMAQRWTKKIDIYMGEDVDKAKNWGEKKVIIYWNAK